MSITLDEDFPFPVKTTEFIDLLDKTYPHLCIRVNQDVIEAHRYSAVREFIDELLVMKADYMEGDSNDPPDEI